jgi:hypothetical protein
MSRTLIITDGKIADENGLLPPPGYTDDKHWFVQVLNGKRKYFFRADANGDDDRWAFQPQLSDKDDVHQPAPPDYPFVIGTSPDGNWVTMSDHEQIYIGSGDSLPIDWTAGPGVPDPNRTVP